MGGAAAVGVIGAMLFYRAQYIEPREWGTACASAVPPFACVPRAALLWLQQWQLWGLTALALGLGSFAAGRPFAAMVAAVALGGVAVANYNASWGMLGAALGGWAWLSRA